MSPVVDKWNMARVSVYVNNNIWLDVNKNAPHYPGMTQKLAGRPIENMSAKPIAKTVMALKAKGLTFSQIGERIGRTRQHAHQIHTRCVAEQSSKPKRKGATK